MVEHRTTRGDSSTGADEIPYETGSVQGVRLGEIAVWFVYSCKHWKLLSFQQYCLTMVDIN